MIRSNNNEIHWLRVNDNHLIRLDGSWSVIYIQPDEEFSFQGGSTHIRMSVKDSKILLNELGIIIVKEDK